MDSEDRTAPPAIASVMGLTHMPITGVCPGIYFLCLHGEVVYVGMSEVVLLRVGKHAADAFKLFDAVYFFPCPVEDLDRRETEWIQKLQPKYNVRKKVPTGAQAEGPPACRVLSFER